MPDFIFFGHLIDVYKWAMFIIMVRTCVRVDPMPTHPDLSKLKDEIRKMLSQELKGSLTFITYRLSLEIGKILIKNSEFNKRYNLQELNAEIMEFFVLPYKKKPENVDDLIQLILQLIDDLMTEKSYCAYLMFPTLINLPIGIKIGSMQIIERPTDEPHLNQHIAFLEKKKLIYPDGRSWAVIHFNSYKTRLVVDDLFRELELPYSILSFVFDVDLDVEQSCGMIEFPNKNILFLSPTSKVSGWSKYDEKYQGKIFNTLIQITQKERQTPLEKKILQGIQLFALSRISRKVEIRFLFTIAAIESLLLTENDRDYLGYKFAEKTTFLIEEDKEKRTELNRLMKRYYSGRSDFIHKGIKTFSKEDEETLSAICRHICVILLELSSKYNKMEQKRRDDDKEGIEDYLNEKKFG